MRIHMPRYRKNGKLVRPRPFHGVLRDVVKIRDDLWEVKITTELSNIGNLYLALDDSEMEVFIKEWKEKGVSK